jgi:LmbE family N-acetylglucosaminyl deacetylase
VLAPHADDETLGCGVNIMRRREMGARVTIVVATNGSESHSSRIISTEELVALRAAEASEAAARLGVPADDVILLGFPDSRLEDRLDDLTDRLADLIRERAPDDILVSSDIDPHPDHRALNSAMRSVVPMLPVDCRVTEFPVWTWVGGPWSRQPGGTPSKIWRLLWEPASSVMGGRPELVATDGYLDRKRHALAAYRTQTSNFTGEPDWAFLSEDFLSYFLRHHEIFFPLRRRPIALRRQRSRPDS